MPTDKEWDNTAEVLKEIYKENMDEWGKIAKVEFTDIVIKFANMYAGTSTEFDVVQFTSLGGYEKRTLRSRRSKRDFDLTYTNVSGVEKHAIEQFYRSRNGSYETFTFDLTHINELGTIQSRFDGPLDITHVFSDSSNTSLQNNYYTVKFKLKEVYD